MKRVIYAASLIVLFQFLMISCAKTPSDDLSGKREQSFEAWMSYNNDGAVRQPSGMYIKWLSTPPTTTDRRKPTDGDWIKINYTGRAMVSGDVFVSRYEDVAKQQGTFKYYTNYVPDYLEYYKNTYQLTKGLFELVGTMSVGDKIRAYMPSYMAYGGAGSSYSNGYEGQIALGANMPVIVDVELMEIISDPISYEATQVRDYAVGVWDKSIRDTLKNGSYYRQLSIGRDTVSVKKDSTVSVYYVGRFLNGHVFDTNIEDTARFYNIYNVGGDYAPKTVRAGSESMVKGFEDGLMAMKYSEVGQVLFTSSYGYGSAGKEGSNSTVIQPYTPLLFTLEIAPIYGDGTLKYPYSVQGVQKLDPVESNVWITGYIVGVVPGSNISGAVFSRDEKVSTNILLASRSNPKSYKECVAVELPEGPVRDSLNLVNNPKIYKYTEVKVLGDVSNDYLGAKGLINATKYKR